MSLTIGLIGQVSSGKSSLINALLGNLVSKVALDRATLRPISYNTNNTTDIISKNEYATIQASIKSGNIASKYESLLNKPVLVNMKTPNNCTIIDFAGIDDGADNTGSDVFLNAFLTNIEQLDVIIFVSRCDNVFVLGNELKLFNVVSSRVKHNNDNGRYQRLIVAANKYDFEDDEIDNIVNSAAKKIEYPIYKISAWKLFLHNACANVKHTDEWQLREYKKMARVKGQSLTTDEKSILNVVSNKDYIFKQRHNTIIEYTTKCLKTDIFAHISHIDNLIKNIANCGIVIKDYTNIISAHLKIDQKEISVLVAYVILRHFGYSLWECLKYVEINIFSCIYFALKGIPTEFGRFIGSSWEFSGTIEVPPELRAVLKNDPNVKVEASISAQHLAYYIIKSSGASHIKYNEIITDSHVIGLIRDENIRKFLLLKDLTYEQIMADLFIDPDHYKTTIDINSSICNDLSYDEFKRQVSIDYFVNNKRGAIYALVSALLKK